MEEEEAKKELKESDRDMKGWLGWSLIQREMDAFHRVKKLYNRILY